MNKKRPKSYVLDSRMHWSIKLLRTVIAFSFLLLCIYVSQGSAWWTLVTGLLFIFFIGVLIQRMNDNERTTFYSKKEALEWLNKQEEWATDEEC